MKSGSEGTPIAKEFEDLAPPPSSPENEIDQAIIKLTKAGKKYREIVKELHVSQQRIATVLKEYGISREKTKGEAQKAMLLFEDELLGSLLELPFDYFAKRYGQFWELSPEEKKKLSALSNKVASKYLPLWLERYADEVGLVVTFSMIVYPRYLQTKAMIEQPKAQPEQPKVESPVV